MKTLAKVLPNGYKPFTTFYEDLGIAEIFGTKAIKDTFKTVKKEWLDDYKYFTEFVLCLNLKSWEHQNDGLCDLYIDLFYKAQDLFFKKYEGNDKAMSHFFEVTD